MQEPEVRHQEPDWETHIAESLLTGHDAPGGAAVLEAEPTVQAPSFFDEVSSSAEIPAVVAEQAEAEADRPAPAPRTEGAKEYKVLSQRDKWFGGRFDAERLEEALNFLAGQGWVVRSMAAGAITGSREELVVLLERG